MCGITGYFGQGNRDILEKMTDALYYRGPDDKGCYVNEQIGLGHRRLSIIDLSIEARQPMSNENDSIKVIFNGEIYNFKALRATLQNKGHKFKTNSDTEVIVHAYEEYQEECFNMFNGMFAIAIWDSDRKKLILARDRLGQKSLYYFFDNKNLIFASEIKSILLHPSVKKDLDELAVFQYFAFDYVPQPRTVFKNIKKLENGQLSIIKNNKLELKYYYKIKIKENFKISEKDAVDNLDKLLSDAVGSRLISDVPLGVFLSGGLDSSTIAYYAKLQEENLKTFSIGFEEKSFDETKYAKQVADYLKTDHYHKQFSGKELINTIPKIFNKLDEPFGDPSILPTYLLSEFTKEKVTVALSGDGGDELLCGYPNHKAQNLLSRLSLHNIKLNKNLVNCIIKLLPAAEKNMAASFVAQRALLSSQFNGLYRDFIVIGSFNSQFNKLFNFEFREDKLFNFVDNFLNYYQDYSYFAKIKLLFQKYYLSDDILFKTDRASMYNSLEARAPFLDFRAADFLNSLPVNLKLKKFESKFILKKLMLGKLPDNIINRKKKGFGIPIAKWLREDLKDYMTDTLSKKNIGESGFLKYNAVEKLIKQHISKEADHRKILWNLIVFVNWHENNGKFIKY